MEVVAENPDLPDGPKVVRFAVRTNSFADTFYKVRTSVSSTLDPSFSRTLKYIKSQQEGSTHREILVEYDYEKGEQVFAGWQHSKDYPDSRSRLRSFVHRILLSLTSISAGHPNHTAHL